MGYALTVAKCCHTHEAVRRFLVTVAVLGCSHSSSHRPAIVPCSPQTVNELACLFPEATVAITVVPYRTETRTVTIDCDHEVDNDACEQRARRTVGVPPGFTIHQVVVSGAIDYVEVSLEVDGERRVVQVKEPGDSFQPAIELTKQGHVVVYIRDRAVFKQGTRDARVTLFATATRPQKFATLTWTGGAATKQNLGDLVTRIQGARQALDQRRFSIIKSNLVVTPNLIGSLVATCGD